MPIIAQSTRTQLSIKLSGGQLTESRTDAVVVTFFYWRTSDGSFKVCKTSYAKTTSNDLVDKRIVLKIVNLGNDAFNLSIEWASPDSGNLLTLHSTELPTRGDTKKEGANGQGTEYSANYRDCNTPSSKVQQRNLEEVTDEHVVRIELQSYD